MQHPEYAVQLRPLPVGGSLCLHHQEGKKDIFSMFAHIPSLQLVTNLPDSNKGGAKGYVLVKGPWASLSEDQERDFCPSYSLKLTGRCSF